MWASLTRLPLFSPNILSQKDTPGSKCAGGSDRRDRGGERDAAMAAGPLALRAVVRYLSWRDEGRHNSPCGSAAREHRLFACLDSLHSDAGFRRGRPVAIFSYC